MSDADGGTPKPLVIYLVEERGPDGSAAQVAGFTSEAEANRLRARLQAEGRETLLNLVPIHERFEDYEQDR